MAVSAPDWGEGGNGRNSDEQLTSARAYPGPWWSQDAVASAALDPPVRASHSEPRLARERGNYNASSISNGQQSLLWGGLDPSALRLRMLQNRSVTQRSMGHGVCTSFKGLVPRTAYPCVHLDNLISVFGDGVSGLSVPTRDVPRSSNIYLSSLPPSASSSFLSCFISALHYFSVFFQTQQIADFAVIPTYLLQHPTQTSKCPVPPPLLPRTSSPCLRTSLSSSSSRPEVLHTSLRSTPIAHHSKSPSNTLLPTHDAPGGSQSNASQEMPPSPSRKQMLTSNSSERVKSARTSSADSISSASTTGSK